MTILSHNVYWFQGVPFDTDQPGDARIEVVQDLMGLYRRIEPDIACLQEIQSPESADLPARSLGFDVHYTEGATLRQYGGAILWREGEILRTSESGDGTQRVWQIGKSGGFSVCNVHLPSSRQLGQARAAVQRMDEIAKATMHRPDLVLGDFNEPPGGSVDQLLTDKGYVDAAAHTGQTARPTNLSGKRGDRIFVQSSVLDRLTGYQTLDVDDLAIDLEGKTSLSDHLPLWVHLEG